MFLVIFLSLLLILSFVVFWTEIDATAMGVVIPLAIDIVIFSFLVDMLGLENQFIRAGIVMSMPFVLLSIKLFLYWFIKEKKRK